MNSTTPNAKSKRMVPREARVSKVLEDRVRADGEQVAQMLEPDRDPDTVLYPDPTAPGSEYDESATSAQTNAEVQMARRTDAGPRMAAIDSLPGAGAALLLWGAAAAGVVLVIAVLIALL